VAVKLFFAVRVWNGPSGQVTVAMRVPVTPLGGVHDAEQPPPHP
jgi:hypothetical protein